MLEITGVSFASRQYPRGAFYFPPPCFMQAKSCRVAGPDRTLSEPIGRRLSHGMLVNERTGLHRQVYQTVEVVVSYSIYYIYRVFGLHL